MVDENTINVSLSETTNLAVSLAETTNIEASLAETTNINVDFGQLVNLGGGALPGNVVVVNPGEQEVVGKSYKTYSDAVAYCLTQSPTADNFWTIFLQSGDITEDIHLYQYVRVEGASGTRITGALTSDVSFTGSEYFDAYILGCTINNYVCGAGKIISMFHCVINGGTPSSSNISVFYKCAFFKPIDLSTSAATLAFSCDFLTTLGSGVYKFANADLNKCNTQTCEFTGSNGVVGGVISGIATVNAGSTLVTYGVAITVDVVNNGIYTNYGDFYDNTASGLTASEVQGAIDETVVLAEIIPTLQQVTTAGATTDQATTYNNTVIVNGELAVSNGDWFFQVSNSGVSIGIIDVADIQITETETNMIQQGVMTFGDIEGENNETIFTINSFTGNFHFENGTINGDSGISVSDGTASMTLTSAGFMAGFDGVCDCYSCRSMQII